MAGRETIESVERAPAMRTERVKIINEEKSAPRSFVDVCPLVNDSNAEFIVQYSIKCLSQIGGIMVLRQWMDPFF